MHDFSQRFGALFQRLQYARFNGGRVEVKRTEGCYPVNEKTAEINTEPSPEQHECWRTSKCTVVTFFYPPDYPLEERSLELSGYISRESTAILIGLGLGPLLHNTYVTDDRWVIFAVEEEETYSRLPPLGGNPSA